MKKIQKLSLFLALFLGNFLFAAKNIAGEIASKAKTELESVTQSIATIINTISLTVGAIWLIVMLLMYFFAVERLKENSKLMIGGLAILGIVYGLSSTFM